MATRTWNSCAADGSTRRTRKEHRTMHMPPPSAAETAQAIELGHEPSTVSVKGVAWFFAIFVAFAVVVHVAIWVMYRQMVKYEESQNVQRSAVASTENHPPEPLLQPTR